MNKKKAGLALGVLALVSAGAIDATSQVLPMNEEQIVEKMQSRLTEIQANAFRQSDWIVANHDEFIKEVAANAVDFEEKQQAAKSTAIEQQSSIPETISEDAPVLLEESSVTEEKTAPKEKKPAEKGTAVAVETVSHNTTQNPETAAEEPVVEEPTISLSGKKAESSEEADSEEKDEAPEVPESIPTEEEKEVEAQLSAAPLPGEGTLVQTTKVEAPKREEITRWTTAVLNVRVGAGTEHAVVGTVEQGQKLSGVEVDGWLEIEKDEKTVYVSAAYLSATEVEKEIEIPTDTPAAEETTGWTTHNLNVRKEASLGSEIVGLLPKGTKVSGTATEGWIKIDADGIEGYVSGEYISSQEVAKEVTPEPTPIEEEQKEETAVDFTGWVKNSLNVREGAGTEYKVLGVLTVGTKVEGKANGGWVQFEYKGKTAYVSKTYLSETEITKPVEKTTEEPEKIASSDSVIDDIVDVAWSFIGYPYVYGQQSPEKGFDCSGLTYYLYKHYAGITLNRVSRDQMKNGYAVSKESLKPGDLVFFKSQGSSTVGHVGIYVGDGQFVHASTPKTGVKVNNLNENYYKRVYAGARRILN